eukprot:2527485-Rhodomonas_salina.1
MGQGSKIDVAHGVVGSTSWQHSQDTHASLRVFGGTYGGIVKSRHPHCLHAGFFVQTVVVAIAAHTVRGAPDVVAKACAVLLQALGTSAAAPLIVPSLRGIGLRVLALLTWAEST